MLENAADMLASYWGNLTCDGNAVVPLPIKNTNEVMMTIITWRCLSTLR